MICLNVAVYRSTRAGKRLFIKLALPLFMLSKKYGHLCNADTWLCPWYRADYYFVTLCFQENPYLFTKTNSNTVISELISDDQDSATDDFPPAAAVALAVCLTAVVVIVVVFVWRTRKSRRRPEARKLLYAPGPHKPRIWTCPERYFWFKLSYTFSPRGSRRWEEKGKVLNRAARASCAHSLLPAPCFLHTSHAPTTTTKVRTPLNNKA